LWHARERGETCRGFWWESRKVKVHLKDQVVDGIMGSKYVLKRFVRGLWSGLTWLRIGFTGGVSECGDEPSNSGGAELFIL
jgi:hypothetical protein